MFQKPRRVIICCGTALFLYFATVGMASASGAVHRGKVTKILKADGFTYLKCLQTEGVRWVALAGSRTIRPGDVVEYSEVAPLPDAGARLAGMTFKEVDFAPEPRIYRNGKLIVTAESAQPREATPETRLLPPMSREEFHKMTSQTIDDPLFFKNPFRKGTGIYEIYRRYAHDMVGDTKIVDYFYDNFFASYGRVSDYPAYGRALASEAVMRGMLRLYEAEFEEVLRITNRIRGKLPVKDGARMVRDKLKFDIQWLELISNEDAARYLELTHKCMLAEISKLPMMPVNSADEKQAALESLMVKIRQGLTQEQQLRYQRIISDLDKSENEEICWAYDVMFGSMFDLPEQPRRWMIREIANSLRGI